MSNAPRYISYKVLHADLKVPTTGEEITEFNFKYRGKTTTTTTHQTNWHPHCLKKKSLEG